MFCEIRRFSVSGPSVISCFGRGGKRLEMMSHQTALSLISPLWLRDSGSGAKELGRQGPSDSVLVMTFICRQFDESHSLDL